MSFVVQITDTALADIERNADWWAEHHSVEQALIWFAAVQEQILSLDNMPERFPLAPENVRFQMDLREKIVGVGPRPNDCSASRRG